jgi:hypothetical protein
MDTRFFGPSGWQLLHLVTFLKGNMEHKQAFFKVMPDVLPCKYCRESTTEFYKEIKPDLNLAYWMYKLHDRVNQKLEKQHAEDPTVEKPVPSPPFEEVVTTYTKLVKELSPKKPPPGRDFLLSIAYNFDPEQHNTESHRTFWEEMRYVYPTNAEGRRKITVPDLTSSKTYLKDVYQILSQLGEMPSFKSISQRLAYYKSGCAKKSYKGKTCRKTNTGGYAKQRDRRRTWRVTHSALL